MVQTCTRQSARPAHVPDRAKCPPEIGTWPYANERHPDPIQKEFRIWSISAYTPGQACRRWEVHGKRFVCATGDVLSLLSHQGNPSQVAAISDMPEAISMSTSLLQASAGYASVVSQNSSAFIIAHSQILEAPAHTRISVNGQALS